MGSYSNSVTSAAPDLSRASLMGTLGFSAFGVNPTGLTKRTMVSPHNTYSSRPNKRDFKQSAVIGSKARRDTEVKMGLFPFGMPDLPILEYS